MLKTPIVTTTHVPFSDEEKLFLEKADLQAAWSVTGVLIAIVAAGMLFGALVVTLLAITGWG